MSVSLPVSGHTNLSALQIIGSCVSSLLGPIKGVKCLFDEEINEGVLVTSTNELLQGLDIEHPVGQLVREFCLSQHKRHGSGCTTLVTLAGLWAANVQSLLNQDVPIQDIIRVGDEFLQGCGDIAEQSAISIPSLSKAAAVTIEREEERDRMMLYISTSLQSSSAEQPIHHGIIMRSEVRETHSVSPNQNSNNSCALLSQTPFQSTTPAGSNHHERWKHAGASGIESSNSSLVKKQARTVLSASSAKIDTSSAILKEDDVDDVSWFFENDSQYSDKAWDTDSIATGNLAGKRDEVSLHGCEQKDSSCVEKAVAEQDDEDDVEWFFEDDHIFLDAVSHHDDHQTTISSSMHEEKGKDVSLKVTDSKESKERLKTGESISQPRHEQPHLKTVQDQEKSEQMVCRKDVHSVLEQSHKVPTKENSFTRTSSVKSSERLESLLKSAIEQKPSKLQKGSRRILSRHLFDDKQDMCALSMASETPVRESTLKMTSNDLGQSRKKDEKAAVLPTLTQNETSSDHVLTQDVRKSFRMHIQNDDVTGILADDVIRTEETTLKEQLSSEIESLGDSLNHGAVAEMELAIEACQAQMMASQDPQRFDFNTDLVHIQTLTGPSSLSSCCIHGLVLTVLENQLNTLHAVTGRRMVALLINSDLQESYRHRGFKDSLKSSSVVSVIPTMGTSPNSVWSERVLSSLNKLNVNLLLVRGSVDSSLVDACCFHDILILEHVPYRLLQLLGTVHKSNLLAYISDALQDDVCDNIKVSYWSSGYDPHPTVRSRDLKIQHHVWIVCPGNVMTIILCAPSEPHLTGAEQRLHSCMARLRGALHDGKVLPGGGKMEQCIVEKLTKEDEHVTDFHPYRRGLVYEALAQGFGAYTQHTHLNTGQCQAIEDASPDAASCHSSPSSNVHDCFLAKKWAWQRAWHLVKQVLLCDALIITGVDKGDKDLHRVL